MHFLLTLGGKEYFVFAWVWNKLQRRSLTSLKFRSTHIKQQPSGLTEIPRCSSQMTRLSSRKIDALACNVISAKAKKLSFFKRRLYNTNLYLNRSIPQLLISISLITLKVLDDTSQGKIIPSKARKISRLDKANKVQTKSHCVNTLLCRAETWDITALSLTTGSLPSVSSLYYSQKCVFNNSLL